MNTKPNKDEEKVPAAQEKPQTGTDVQVYDFGDDAGAGMENVTRDEYKIPFLSILDPKSPQCKPKSAGGLGLKAGDIYNTATGEAYNGEAGFDFIPVSRDENYPEFISRKEDGSGGGFVGIRAPDDALVLKLRAEQGKFGRLKVPPQSGGEWIPGVDHELAQTYYLYGILIVPDTQQPMPVLIGFKSTQIDKYKGLITRQNNITYPTPKGIVRPPLWAHFWHFATKYEEKNQRSWYGWVIGLKAEPSSKALLKMSDPLYQMAKDLYAAIKGGQRAADYAAQNQTAAATEEEIPM